MTAFVKPMLTSALAVGCLAVAGGAQQPTPPAPPAAPALPAFAPVAGQGGVAVIQTVPGQPATVRNVQGNALTLAPGSWSANEARVFGFMGSADDVKAQQLTKKLVEAKTDEAKEKLRDEIKAALEKAFAERQKRHEDQIKQLEEQVKKLKKIVSERQENKGEIIADRMKQLEKDAKGLGWQ
ncbi:MAG: hypothetical protein U0871_09915 [Gemmataceae bacterium]